MSDGARDRARVRLAALVLAAGALALAVWCGGALALVPPRFTLPRTPAECRARGGYWAQRGSLQQYACNLPAPDAGRVCFSARTCTGGCEPAVEALGYAAGRCGEWIMQIRDGCFPQVEDARRVERCFE